MIDPRYVREALHHGLNLVSACLLYFEKQEKGVLTQSAVDQLETWVRAAYESGVAGPEFLNRLTALNNAIDVVRRLFWPQPPEQAAEDENSPFKMLNDAQAIFKDVIESYSAQIEAAQANISELPVPDQELGPFKFAFIDERLTVLAQENEVALADVENVTAARNALVEWSKGIDVTLQGLNTVSPRLIQAWGDLLKQLPLRANAIHLGMTGMRVSAVVASLNNVLSDDLYADLRAFSAQVMDFVAQFPEWRHYNENAANAQIDDETTVKLGEASLELANKLKTSPSVDPAVVEALTEAGTWAEQKPLIGRIKLSLKTTLINIFSATMNFVKDVRGDLREAARTAIVAVILGVAVHFLGPLALLPGGEWLVPALGAIQVALKSKTDTK